MNLNDIFHNYNQINLCEIELTTIKLNLNESV